MLTEFVRCGQYVCVQRIIGKIGVRLTCARGREISIKQSSITEQRKMLLSESLVVKFLVLLNKRIRSSVHQMYKGRFNFGELYTELRANEKLFRSYTRMTTSTLDYIKEAIEHECYHIITFIPKYRSFLYFGNKNIHFYIKKKNTKTKLNFMLSISTLHVQKPVFFLISLSVNGCGLPMSRRSKSVCQV